MTDTLAQRVWNKDGSAWSVEPAVQRWIPSALGWLDIATAMARQIDLFTTLAAEVRQAGFRDMFLLGMGGSSLCPDVLRQTFGSAPGYPLLTVLDTTHPETIAAASAGIDLASTLFLVSSKSGGTVETLSLFRYFDAKVVSIKGERAGKSFIALTDPGTSLESLARRRGFRRVLSTPPEVGGRYSALTYFGLVPAALIGLDVRELLERGQAMMRRCQAHDPGENPGLQLGLTLGKHALDGQDKVTIVAPAAIASFGIWVEQLLAESTGKQARGLIPVAGEPVGSPEAYGSDRVFVYLRLTELPDRDLDARVGALERAGQPVIRIELADRLDLGAELFRWEFATAIAGAVLRINPFDQPNVQESKDNTHAVLAEYERSGALPSVSAASDDVVVADLLKQARVGDYVAIMAYLPLSEPVEQALQAFRTDIRDGLGVATTVGYGPRFLHSTGQLHKGGPNSGLFIQLVAEPAQDLAIPGQPYTFGTLIRAQAIGDLRSLEAHGRRVVRVDLGSDVEAGLARLQAVVTTALGRNGSRTTHRPAGVPPVSGDAGRAARAPTQQPRRGNDLGNTQEAP